MDKKLVIKRIDELIEEKRITSYVLKENAELSSIIYQWRKNSTRDATRSPSLRSIEKVCSFFGVSLSYFFAFDIDEQKEIKHRDLVDLIETLSNDEVDILTSLIVLLKKKQN